MRFIICGIGIYYIQLFCSLLLKDMDLGMAAAKAHGVAMPSAAATRESVARMIGRGYGDIDFSALLIETAKDAGLELKSENKTISDGLEAQ
jgi:3-hydroxyisobutyrate dehydrogenase